MGYVIKITHDKVADLSENIEKGLRYMGKAMQCVDELLGDDYGYGERGRYGERDDEDWDDDDRYDRMGERDYGRGRMGRGYGERRGRRRDSRGRYM